MIFILLPVQFRIFIKYATFYALAFLFSSCGKDGTSGSAGTIYNVAIAAAACPNNTTITLTLYNNAPYPATIPPTITESTDIENENTLTLHGIQCESGQQTWVGPATIFTIPANDSVDVVLTCSSFNCAVTPATVLTCTVFPFANTPAFTINSQVISCTQ